MRVCTSSSSVVTSILAGLALACSSGVPGGGAPQPSRLATDVSPIERAVMAAAIDSIAAGWRDSTALCLRLLGGPAGVELPPDSLLRALHTRHQPVAANAC